VGRLSSNSSSGRPCAHRGAITLPGGPDGRLQQTLNRFPGGLWRHGRPFRGSIAILGPGHNRCALSHRRFYLGLFLTGLDGNVACAFPEKPNLAAPLTILYVLVLPRFALCIPDPLIDVFFIIWARKKIAEGFTRRCDSTLSAFVRHSPNPATSATAGGSAAIACANYAVNPPSIARLAPVMNPASGLAIMFELSHPPGDVKPRFSRNCLRFGLVIRQTPLPSSSVLPRAGPFELVWRDG